MGLKLYRSGVLEKDTKAPLIASTFDSYATDAGAQKLKSYVPRASAAFFCLSQAEAFRWTGWRLNEGLDASIYEYDVPDNYEVFSYPVGVYNKFLSTHHENILHFSELALSYYQSAKDSSFETYSSNMMWEVLAPLDKAADWEHRIVKDIFSL